MAECREILNERNQGSEERDPNGEQHCNHLQQNLTRQNRTDEPKTNNQAQEKLTESEQQVFPLLLTIARHVNYSKDNLEDMADDVGMPMGLLTQKMADLPDTRSKILEVFKFWYDSAVGLTVRDVIHRVEDWIDKELVFRDVWPNIQKLVSFRLRDLPEPPDPGPSPENCSCSCASSSLRTPGSLHSSVSSASSSTASSSASVTSPSNETKVFCFPLLGFVRPPKGTISSKRFRKLQKWAKQSLREKPFSTAKGKIWTETPSNIPLQEIFTKLCWVKNSRKTHGMEVEDLSDITQLLNERQLGKNGPVRILVQGPGGIGKSTAMKHLALCWADGSVDDLKQFHFIFHIALKDVKSYDRFEDIIIAQHKGLSGNNVHPEEVKALLEGYPNLNILILLDGHDEYKPGRNVEIDKALTKDFLRNCWIIITSRETKELNKLREYTDAEATITGFDEQKVEEYITKYLGCQERCGQFLDATRISGLHQSKSYGILCIPIMLHMVCVLFVSMDSLPKSKSGILSAIMKKCIDWDAFRSTGKRCVKDVEDVIIRLGKLALKGLQREHLQQTFHKDEILDMVGKEALHLGLLMRTQSCSTQEVETEMFCFHYLLLQEFIAGKYVTTLNKHQLQDLFPTWDSILKHREVIRFACGLRAEDQTILEFVYDTLTQHCRQETDTADIGKWLLNQCTSFPRSLCEEVSDFVSIDPLHNGYINYINAFDTTICIPSRFYVFNPGRVYMFNESIDSSAMTYRIDESALTNNNGTLPSECAIYRTKGNDQLYNTLWVLQEIRKYQQVVISHLVVSSFVSGDDDNIGLDRDGLEFRNAKSLTFEWCTLSLPSYNYLVQELNDCNMLVHLDLRGTAGVPKELGKAIATMTSLETFSMRWCQMNSFVSCSLLAGLSQCRNLRYLELSYNTLTGYLDKLLNGPDNQGFPFLERLSLDNTFLSKGDIKSISVAVKQGKLSKLQRLDLLHNTLTDYVGDLLNARNHPGFPHLAVLDLTETRLSRRDVENLNAAARAHKLPKLTNLYLSYNTLTQCVEELVKGSAQSLFPSLEALWMTHAMLGRSDMVSLSTAALHGRLPKLKILHLEGNASISEGVGGLLGDAGHPGFPLLQELNLRSTKLTESDVTSCIAAVNCDKLPQLKYLNIGLQDRGVTKIAVKRLVKACVAKYSRELSPEDEADELNNMRLWLSAATFPAAFCAKMESLCQKNQIDFRL